MLKDIFSRQNQWNEFCMSCKIEKSKKFAKDPKNRPLLDTLVAHDMADRLLNKDFLPFFESELNCLSYLFFSRFGFSYNCAECTKDNSSNWKPDLDKRHFYCNCCGSQIFPLAGTPLEGSRSPLVSVFGAINTFADESDSALGKRIAVERRTAKRLNDILSPLKMEFENRIVCLKDRYIFLSDKLHDWHRFLFIEKSNYASYFNKGFDPALLHSDILSYMKCDEPAFVRSLRMERIQRLPSILPAEVSY